MFFATHNGPFHADDVMAAAILKTVYPDTNIVRTRDPAVLEKASVVFDVGGRFDRVKWFDHHQDDAPVRPDGSPYSSAGLIWAYLGYEFVPLEARIYVDERLMKPIDLVDNGQGPREGLSFSAVVSAFNPTWNERQQFDDQFAIAVDLAKVVLQQFIASGMAHAEALACAQTAYDNATDKRVVVLDQFHPWQDVLCPQSEPLFVAFPDATSGTWRIQCVPVEAGSFESRKPLPSEWRDNPPEGITFVHKNLFIAGVTTRDRAVELALSI